MRPLLGSMLASALCLASVPVLAASPRNHSEAVLKVDISAQVVGRCGIEANGARTNDAARIDQPSVITFNFQLDCNTPFRIGLAAKNGGMRLDGAAPGENDAQGFAIVKPYDVALSFGTDQAGQVDAGSCAAAAISAAQPACAFYGAAPGAGFSPGELITAIQKDGTLAVSWKGEDGDTVRLAAGDYRDVITVVVGPRT